MKEEVGSRPAVHGAGSEEAKETSFLSKKPVSHADFSGPPTECDQSHLVSMYV